MENINKLLEARQLLKEALSTMRSYTYDYAKTSSLCNRIDEFLKEK